MYSQSPPADSVALTPLTAWLDLSLGRCLLRRLGPEASGVPGWSVSPRDALGRLGITPQPNAAADVATRQAEADDLLVRTRSILPVRIAQVAETFALSDTELRLLCLVLAPELDGRYSTVIGVLQDDLHHRRPGLTLLAELMPQPTTVWDLRCTAYASMVTAGLLRPDTTTGAPTVDAGIAPADAVVAHLLAPSADKAAVAIGARYRPPGGDIELSAEETEMARRLRRHTVVRLADAGSWFERLAASIDVPLIIGDLTTVEARGDAVADWTVLSRLTHSGLMLRGAGPSEHHWLITASETVRLVAADSDLLTGLLLRAPVVTSTQRARWWSSAATRGGLDLGPADIRRLAATSLIDPEQMDRILATTPCADGESHVAQVQRAARDLSRTGLPPGVRQVEPVYGWNDIVLAEERKHLLKAIPAHVLHAGRVLQEWGFAGRLPYGHGVVALFAGPSGTGKTMAAQIIARELGVDLFHIDLSKTISKYIGETEKNLEAVFDAAERAGAVLLFDEADALFGKRTEVKDAHDRHANVEVSYLLQRMESFRGLAILTSNVKQNIDGAFVRRLRFVVDFTMPTAAERRSIWRKAFPGDAPLAREVDIDPLANRLAIPGGSIQNIALHAAFLAAPSGDPISPDAVLAATRRELHKIGMLSAERDLPKQPAVSS
ncbi:ATP-binding protein [Streptomyces sp. NPDC057302]|uniref:ATP-binding protein n=1 Tax=Streptomyces sp. NPDC057302 TaxID=3346094 RepID=UPI003642FFF2